VGLAGGYHSGQDKRRMKVAHIATGAANMYCGSCIRNNTLVAAMKAMGHDLVMLPRFDIGSAQISPVRPGVALGVEDAMTTPRHAAIMSGP